ncbi:MAG: MFS transporter, partial [Pseudomonadota bacterium]
MSETNSPFKEITQPFVDLVRAPRALWGINLPYFIEGVVYWGILGYLHMYFNRYVGLDDIWANRMVGVLTAGITISMFFFGTLADKWGVRIAIIFAFMLMLVGRVLLAGGPYLDLEAQGLWTTLNAVAMSGILLIVLGYGMYQPAAYSAVRQFTNAKTAGMGFAMLYALMNLGGWVPTWFTPIRKSLGISGAYCFLAGLTVVALLTTIFILTRGTVEKAIAFAKAEREQEEKEKAEKASEGKQDSSAISGGQQEGASLGMKIGRWFANHPLADPKFAFFIFCLIPVQTLFAHNWLTLPMYVERAYRDTWPWISVNFEKAVNFNPLLVFILVP